MKQPKSILKVLPIAAALFFVGCSECVTDVITGSELTSGETEVTQEYPEKNCNTRTAVSWQRVSYSIKNARDIAAFHEAYVISSDGRTVYMEKDGTFNPIVAQTDVFANDPATTIAAGSRSVVSAGPAGSAVCMGVYVTTESKTAYRLVYRSNGAGSYYLWQPVSTDVGAGVAVTNLDDNKSKAWLLADNSNNDYVMRTDFFTNNWTRYDNNVNKDIIAIDAGARFWKNRSIIIPGAYFLCADNTVLTMEEHYTGTPTDFIQVGTANIVPDKDIAASPVENGAFAVFEKNSNICHYIKDGQSVKVGYARKISIDKEGYLWDAYTSGIYKIKLN